jgi:Na+/melibiose symporter-like transporter
MIHMILGEIDWQWVWKEMDATYVIVPIILVIGIWATWSSHQTDKESGLVTRWKFHQGLKNPSWASFIVTSAIALPAIWWVYYVIFVLNEEDWLPVVALPALFGFWFLGIAFWDILPELIKRPKK